MDSLHSLAVLSNFRALGKRKAAITSAKAVRSLGERQLRNHLQGWPAFFVGPVRWRTGHCHWVRRLTRQLKSPKGQH